MNKTTDAQKLAEEALNASFSLLNLIRRDKAWNTDIVDSVLDSIRDALADHSGDANEMVAEPWKCTCGANLYIDSNGAPASKAEHKCSEHPDAPHGFDRNASHNAGRYVCGREGWEPVKQEPVYELEVREFFEGFLVRKKSLSHKLRPYIKSGTGLPAGTYKLYAAPVSAKREWVDLTDRELDECWYKSTEGGWRSLFRTVIAKFKEKNK